MRIYSTLTRSKDEFVPRDEGKVAMYACGPTVYNHIHIGNARTFLSFDMIRRYLDYAGYDVTFVQNVTDVDDKIINQARQEKGSDDIVPADVAKVAANYTRAYEEAMDALRVVPPDIAPKATDHIDGMIEMISALIERGHAYEVDGDVYFEVRKFAEYGKLSGRSLDDMRAGERVEIDERKRDPMDFALWKSAKPGEPSWDSPWGKGRPGWHIECSVMSSKYLGDSFDVHGGACDLIFPHHENELAQSEAATGIKPFARNWMHAGLLNVNKEKMAKSLGNFTLLKDVLAHSEDDKAAGRYDANEIRMLMLGAHYRKPLDFSDAALDEARAKIERIDNCLKEVDWRTREVEVAGPGDSDLARAVCDCESQFKAEMDDDFNTAGALGALFQLVTTVNVFMRERPNTLSTTDAVDAKCAADMIRELTDVLGLELGGPARPAVSPGTAYWVDAPPQGVTIDLPSGGEVHLSQAEAQSLRDGAEGMNLYAEDCSELFQLFLAKRAEARAAKDWAASDSIREVLQNAGLSVEDTPQGQRVSLVSRGKA